MKVKITSCCSSIYWYRDLIGSEFNVFLDDESGKYCVKNYEIRGCPCCIERCDFEIVKDYSLDALAQSKDKYPLFKVVESIDNTQAIEDEVSEYLKNGYTVKDTSVTEFMNDGVFYTRFVVFLVSSNEI